MFANVQTLFIEKVVADFEEFISSRESGNAGRNQDISKGINAASWLYHFREHLPDTLRKTRDELASVCPDYDLLGYVVDATKHAKIERRNPPITSADCIYELIEIIEYKDDDGPYRLARAAPELSESTGIPKSTIW